MWHLFAISLPWLPSLLAGALISVSCAAIFAIWFFLDCSFPETARLAGRNLRLRYLRDADLRFWNRWECYGPRLLLFFVLAFAGAASAAIAILRLATGGLRNRSAAEFAISFALAVIWIAFFVFHRRLWWIAFRRRVARLWPAMKAAAGALEHWASASIFLPGLGNYAPSRSDANLLLSDDPSPWPMLFKEKVGGIRRKPGECLRFGIESYLGCCVEYRADGWTPQPVSVAEHWSHTKTVRLQSQFPLGGAWHLAFYTSELAFHDGVDPDVQAKLAERPRSLQLPHRAGRFRARADVEVCVQHLLAVGNGNPLPFDFRWSVLPGDEVLRLHYEPDPSRSTHCTLVPEDYARLEPQMVYPKVKRDRDYAGYRVFISYDQLAAEFEWLQDGPLAAGA